MDMNIIIELAAVVLSSAGLIGTVVAGILTVVLRQTKVVAEKRREERIQLELQRLDGEEKLSQLILVLIKFSKGLCEMDELDNAERNYITYLEKTRESKNEILTEHIIK
jgi:endonuclease III